MKTLKEICESAGITRRQLQGFEAAGLVKYSKKNKMGHLLYDEEAEERVKAVANYHVLGFKHDEIRILIDADNETIRCALKHKQLELEAQKTNLDMLIKMIDKRLM